MQQASLKGAAGRAVCDKLIQFFMSEAFLSGQKLETIQFFKKLKKSGA